MTTFVHDSSTTIGYEEIFSRNSEASASEFLENPEEMFHRYCVNSVIFINSNNYSTIQYIIENPLR